MSQNETQVQELRSLFLKKLAESEPELYHPTDISRVKTDDEYLNRFLLHNDSNLETALTMLLETCEWRKKFGVNDINEKTVNMAILESGSVYPYGKDKDGKTLLVFKSKKHFKAAFDFEDQKRCLVYWMERLQRQENGDMISLFFDMEGAVLANMDMEYTKYLISLFKNYYPHFLNYIIIFEMAWVLNAVFKIIKSWLPPKAVEKMKFINKSNAKDYIDPETALKSWGGNSTYVFAFESEELRPTPPPPSSVNDDNRKKVHFADGSFKQDQLNESGFEDSTTPVTSSRLTITPTVMVFVSEGGEVTSSISLKNEDVQWISYKIKTTSPEKFRVRPSAGVLKPSSNVTVNVVLLSEYRLSSVQRDKFLIMSIPIDHSSTSPQEINELWKQAKDKDVHQYRLRCSVPQTVSNEFSMKNGSAFNSQSADDPKMLTKLCSDITKLNSYVGNLKEEMRLIRQQQLVIIFAIILLLCSVTYVMFKDYMTPPEENCWADERRGK